MPTTMRTTLPTFLFLLGGLAAQTTYVAPTGYGSLPGSGGNAIPLWSGSAVYQQVHDAADLMTVFPTPVVPIRSISFRIPNGGSLAARTLDAQVTMGVTPVSAATATTTFASNLGPNPQVVLPYTTLNMPQVSSTSNPNPQSWFFPFQTPFVYPIPTGNLCYELRLRNLSATGGSLDTVSGTSSRLDPLLGTGCTATGQTSPAGIGTRSLNMSTGAWINRLDRGAASASAAMVIGTTAQQLMLPGMCSSLETLPLLSVTGTTDATGTWNHTLTFGRLYGFPRVTLYAQFAWLDAGLPYGFGVSNCSPASTPPPTQTRIWFGPSNSGQGNENATSGSRETGYQYALVMGFGV
jgi:hypothetical protein